jgi:hypothetical protein
MEEGFQVFSFESSDRTLFSVFGTNSKLLRSEKKERPCEETKHSDYSTGY